MVTMKTGCMGWNSKTNARVSKGALKGESIQAVVRGFTEDLRVKGRQKKPHENVQKDQGILPLSMSSFHTQVTLCWPSPIRTPASFP